MTWMCQTDAAQWWRQWRESGTSAVGVATALVVMMMLQAVKRLTWQRRQAVMGVQEEEEVEEGHGIVVSQTRLASLLCVQSRVRARLGSEEAVWP